MLTPHDLATLFDLPHQAAPLLLGALFPFFGKEEKPAISTRTVQQITGAVHHFLEARGVENFKVFTLVYHDKPVVLVQAEPQRKLRFSNILEIQIKQFIREKLKLDIAAVFWRFKTDASEKPGPEQADYDYEEPPTSPRERQQAAGPAAATPSAVGEQGSAPRAAPQTEPQEDLYDVRHTKNNLEVEEITLSEFDEFLKGSSTLAPEETNK